MTKVLRLGYVVVVMWLAVPLSAGPEARQQEDDDVQNISLAPIECWMRTTTRSVRVGEPFSLVLTCAVVETQSTTVIPDQSRLDPSVVAMAPFEVVDGSQSSDLRTASHRFFQYEYTMRFFGETFGSDVSLPGLSIPYRVQSHVEPDAVVEGRERRYDLPPMAIRIVSLVPTDAADIEDRPPPTFRSIEARHLRANSLRILEWLLYGLVAITMVFAMVPAIRRRPGLSTETRLLASDWTVLAGVERALARVKRERDVEGWTGSKAAEALAALRVAASYAVSWPVAQTLPTADAAQVSGQLTVMEGWFRRRSILVSSSMTAAGVARARRERQQSGPTPEELIGLQEAIERFNAAVYGRAGVTESGLDSAFDHGARAVHAGARRRGRLAGMMRTVTAFVANLRGRTWPR